MRDGTLPKLPNYDAPRDRGALASRRGASATPFARPRSDAGRTGVYIKASAPFTSGNIHIGHVRSYAIGDAYARFQRARGEPVLFAFGFDAFGLPAELGAIANGESPSEWVERCATHMTGQLQRLGFSFDWERTFMSSDAVMYRWSQWLFLTLLEAGLIYQGSGSVDWCDTCQTTLATIQVEDGTLLALPQPGAADPAPAVVPARQRLRRGERPAPGGAARNGTRPRWRASASCSAASTGSSWRRAGGRCADGRREPSTLTVFTPYADALEQARFVAISPQAPRGRALDGRRGGAASAWRSCARVAGSAAPAGPRRSRWSTPGAR